VKKKWADLKSKGGKKEVKNRNETGNKPLIRLSIWEEEVVNFIREKKSHILDGIPGGFESGVRGGTVLDENERSGYSREDLIETETVPRPDSPTGDLHGLLRSVRPPNSTQAAAPITPISEESIYEDAADGIPHIRPVSRSSSADVRGLNRNTAPPPTTEVGSSVRNLAQPANSSINDRRVSGGRRASLPLVGSDVELFTENSIAGRKRELELAHMQYFKAQTENIKEATAKIRADKEFNEIAKRKLEFEVENLQIDKRIKLLTERKLELSVFKTEIELSR
jgi:hypothetical protein